MMLIQGFDRVVTALEAISGTGTAVPGTFTTLTASSTLAVAGVSTLTGGFSAGTNSSVTGTLGIKINSGTGVLTNIGGGARIGLSGAATTNLFNSNSNLGTDLKTWSWRNAGNFQIIAADDAFSTSTDAYIIHRGTTTNVADHAWYTSTVAATPVLTLFLSMKSGKTALNGTWATSSAGLATGDLWNNSGVINVA